MAAPATPSPNPNTFMWSANSVISRVGNINRMAHIARHFQHLRGKVLYQMNWRSGRKYEKIRRGIALDIGTATKQTG